MSKIAPHEQCKLLQHYNASLCGLPTYTVQQWIIMFYKIIHNCMSCFYHLAIHSQWVWF